MLLKNFRLVYSLEGIFVVLEEFKIFQAISGGMCIDLNPDF
jgi:hypothetical protein